MDIHLEEQAEALIVESLILGRQAMQEDIDGLCVRDRWRVYRNKQLLHAEDLYLDMRRGMNARSQCILHQHGAFSTLVLAACQHDEWYDSLLLRVRSLAASTAGEIKIGSSVLPSRLVVRVLAPNSYQLRKFLIPCIELLNGGRSVPTVWNV